MALKFLNKKGWHTGSLRNIENVWKAEQKRDNEKRKLEELRKQIRDEHEKQEVRQLQVQAGLVSGSERLEFLYSGLGAGKSSSEDHLLGKPVEDTKEDNVLEQVAAAPGSLFVEEKISANDSWRKIRSDPLLSIRQQEMAARKRVMNNPVLVERLKKEAKEKLDEQKRLKAEKKQKRKELKRKRKAAKGKESDSGSEEDSAPPKRSRDEPGSDSKGNSVSRDNDDRRRDRDEETSFRNDPVRDDNRRDNTDRRRDREDDRRRDRDRSDSRRRDRDDGDDRRRDREGRRRDDDRGRDRSEDTRVREEARTDGDRRRDRDEERKSREGDKPEDAGRDRPEGSRSTGKPPLPRKKQLTDEEKAARLRQMQVDAELHEEDRWRRLKKAAIDDAAQEKKDAVRTSNNFLEQTNRSVYGTDNSEGSVADTLHRKSHYRDKFTDSNAFRR